MTIKHKDIIQAYLDGETIEVLTPSDTRWVPLNTNHCVVFHDDYQYRVMPKVTERYYAYSPRKDGWVDVTGMNDIGNYSFLIKTSSTTSQLPDSVTIINNGTLMHEAFM